MAQYGEVKNRAIVVGAGIGGLAAGIRLRSQGWEVRVYEKQASAGGKIGEWRSDGFRFDTGPSLFTLPSLIDDLFRCAGKNPRDYFNYRALKEGTFYFYEDGTYLAPGTDSARLSETLNKATGEPVSNIEAFLEKSAEKYNITKPVFLEKSLHRKSTYWRKSTLKRFLKLHRLEATRTMAGANQKQFRDKRVQQFFNRYATFNGSNPYHTPATFNVIPHLEHNVGAYFPEGGMYQIIQALVQLAEDMGVVFHWQEPVQKLIVSNGAVQGLKTSNDEVIYAETVISNLDVHATYRYLLPGNIWPRRFLDQPKSSSALIFYWGVKGHFPKLGLHNILFAKDYRSEFEAIFDHMTLQQDPTVYIYISSRLNPEDAPEEHENWYVMINVPWDNGQDWDQIICDARKSIIQKIERLTGYEIRERIVLEAKRDPRDLEAETGAYLGALYGNSANNMLAAFLRHPNFSTKVNNLYFCGGTVHPGGGIPLCLLSAKIATELVEADLSS